MEELMLITTDAALSTTWTVQSDDVIVCRDWRLYINVFFFFIFNFFFPIFNWHVLAPEVIVFCVMRSVPQTFWVDFFPMFIICFSV